MTELYFQNPDDTPKVTIVKARKCDVPAIIRWYNAFYAGDRYRVLIDGVPVKINDGEIAAGEKDGTK